RLHPYSQGDGGSFVMAKPLSEGETVSVRGKLRSGSSSHTFAFHFTVATRDVLPYSKPTEPSGLDYNEKQHFRSRPDLEPPGIVVTTRSPQAEAGDIFAAPYTGPGPPGTMI